MAVSIKINAAAARMTQIAQELYDKGTGYSQARRASALDFDKLAIRPNQDTDCSFAQGIIWVKAGLIPVSVLRGTFYSGNIASVAKRHGFQIISLAGKSLSQIKSLMREGDALVGPGHVVHVGPNGRVLSWEQNELGKASGGKPGRQPGEKVGWRNMYARSRGWAYLMRPPAVKVDPVGKAKQGNTEAKVAKKKRTPKRQSTLPVSVQQRIAGAKVDGKRGPETVSKLKALQKRLGVAQDGVWGPITARAYLASKGNLRRGSVGPWVRVIQHAGGVTRDGVWGTNTDAAVREMQAWAGITIDGVVGPASRIKIIN